MKTLGWLQSIRLPHLYTATPAKENVLKRTECATESGFTCLTYWNSSEFFDGFVGSMADLWWLSHHVTVKVCPVNPFGSIRIRGCMKKVVGGIHIYTFRSFSMNPWKTLLSIRNAGYNSWYVYPESKNLIIECVWTDRNTSLLRSID